MSPASRNNAGKRSPRARPGHGTERALAKACGLSHGIIGKYRRERGLRVDKLSGRLIPADGPDSLERIARQELVAECEAKGMTLAATAEELGVCRDTVRKDKAAVASKKKETESYPRGQDSAPAPESCPRGQDSAPAPPPDGAGNVSTPAPAPTPEPVPPSGRDAVLDAAEDTVADLTKHLRAVARGVDSLIASKVGAQLRTKAKLAGVPFDVREVDVELAIPKAGDPMKKLVVSWPALVGLMETFAQLSAELAMAAFGPEK